MADSNVFSGSPSSSRLKIIDEVSDNEHDQNSGAKRRRLDSFESQLNPDVSSDTEMDSIIRDMSPIAASGMLHQSFTDEELEFIAAELDATERIAIASRSTIEPKSIQDLPDDVLEEIFCRLPLRDLLQNWCLASRRFYNFIANEKFLFWKKIYARYCRRDVKAVHFVEVKVRDEIIGSNHPLGVEELIKYMTATKSVSIEARKLLSAHPLYSAAVEAVKKVYNVEEICESEDGNGFPLGSLVAAMVVMSDGVESIAKIIKLLTAEPCTLHNWIDYFYRLLTVFKAYSQLCSTRGQAERLHYQLKYAVYLFENFCPKFEELAETIIAGGAGQSVNGRHDSEANRQLTLEQRRIVDYDLQPKDWVCITAFAGTGKTTTLIEYCRKRPSKRFLVIFFNRDAADDAANRFPPNATCRNIHRIALASGPFQGEIWSSLPNYTAISKLTKDIKGLDSSLWAELIRETLKSYFASAGREITTLYVPDKWWSRIATTNGAWICKCRHINEDIRLKISEQAQTIWTNMKTGNLKMYHDGYLKLYQLCNARIEGYDAVLVDEAQDCSPAVLDIIKRKCSVPKILVGDPNQQIYSFRKAINALGAVPFTKSFYLTQSFRFGPEIAFVANAWMHKLLGDQKKFLIGNDHPSRLDGAMVGKVAILCRTNFAVFVESVTIAERERRPCLLIGSIRKPFDFGPLKTLWRLYCHDGPYRSSKFDDAKRRAMLLNDMDQLSKIAIVEKYKENTMDRIELINKCIDPNEARFIITTVHKAKGLEFDTVRLANDFECDPDDHTMPQDGDELNLVYVAMTRAKSSLILSQTVYNILIRRFGPMFVWPALGISGSEAVCANCHQDFGGVATIFLVRKPIALSRANTVDHRTERRLCKQCAAGGHSSNDPNSPVETDMNDGYFYLPLLGPAKQ